MFQVMQYRLINPHGVTIVVKYKPSQNNEIKAEANSPKYIY